MGQMASQALIIRRIADRLSGSAETVRGVRCRACSAQQSSPRREDAGGALSCVRIVERAERSVGPGSAKRSVGALGAKPPRIKKGGWVGLL